MICGRWIAVDWTDRIRFFIPITSIRSICVGISDWISTTKTYYSHLDLIHLPRAGANAGENFDRAVETVSAG